MRSPTTNQDNLRKSPGRSQYLANEISTMHLVAFVTQFLAVPLIIAMLVNIKKSSAPLVAVFLVLALPLEAAFLYAVIKARKMKAEKKEIDKNPPPQIVFAEPLYKNKGYTYDLAFEHYCKQCGKKKLTKEEQHIVWEYSYDDFAYLLMWIIENGFYQPSKELDEDEARQMRSYVAKIKRREEKPTELLIGNDGIFLDDEVKKKTRAFMKEYYQETYEQEVTAFAKAHLQTELYAFPFRWEDYDAFKHHIDEAYAAYQAKHAAGEHKEETTNE